MNELFTWMQNNWYALGNLLAQFTFLIAAVWFARKILKTLRASQEQVGALLKLTVSDGLNERPKASPATGHPPTPYVASDWPARTETRSLSEELSRQAVMSAPMASTPDPTPFVAAPLTLPEDGHIGGRLAAAGRGVVQWLQTPMVSNGPSPWRKAVRWLQAPASH
jgi:hypothetical protein